MSDEIILQSSDDIQFKVPRDVAEKSATIKNMLEDIGDTAADPVIPLPNVSGNVLEKVIEYCTHHRNDAPSSSEQSDDKRTDDIKPWDADFCKVDQAVLFELILASNYLDIKSLLDLTCKTVANMIKGMFYAPLRLQRRVYCAF